MTVPTHRVAIVLKGEETEHKRLSVRGELSGSDGTFGDLQSGAFQRDFIVRDAPRGIRRGAKLIDLDDERRLYRIEFATSHGSIMGIDVLVRCIGTGSTDENLRPLVTGRAFSDAFSPAFG